MACQIVKQRQDVDASIKPYSAIHNDTSFHDWLLLKKTIHTESIAVNETNTTIKQISFEPAFDTLLTLVETRARLTPQKQAYKFLYETGNNPIVTFNDIKNKAIQIAIVLQKRLLEKERILLLFQPGLEFICAFYGCVFAGAIPVPAYPPKLNRSIIRLNTIAHDAQAKLALTTDTILKSVHSRIDENTPLKHLDWLAIDALAHRSPSEWQRPNSQPEDTAFLQYTSGSTANPKGVMVTNKNILYNCEMIKHAFEHDTDFVSFSWLPPYHDMGLIGHILQPMYLGILSILMSPTTFLQNPYSWLKAISDYRVTTSGGPNFAYQLCVQKITPEQKKTLDLSCWEIAFTGAEPIHAETINAFSRAFASCHFRKSTFYPCYGLAEATLFVSGANKSTEPIIQEVDSFAMRKNRIERVSKQTKKIATLVSCGRASSAQRVKILDPVTLTESPRNWIGEVWIQGPNVTKGYWNNPEATRAAYKAYLADTREGPFLRTGDLGFLREDNELFITGRLKDLIIINGKNFYPQDMELLVEKNETAIKPHAVAAFSVEKEKSEAVVIVAELIREALKKCNPNQIGENIKKAFYEQFEVIPETLVLIKPGTMPKTSSGKIQRHVARDQYLSQQLETVAVWNSKTSRQATLQLFKPITETESALLALVQEVFDTDHISTADDFFSLGGNSLMAAQLIKRIEDTFVITIEFQTLLEIKNIMQLALLIDEKQQAVLSTVSTSELNHLISSVAPPTKMATPVAADVQA